MHFSFRYGCIYFGRMHSKTATYRFVENLLWKCQNRGQWKRKLQEVFNEGFVLGSAADEANEGLQR